MLRAMAAYRVFCARSLADTMRKVRIFAVRGAAMRGVLCTDCRLESAANDASVRRETTGQKRAVLEQQAVRAGHIQINSVGADSDIVLLYHARAVDDRSLC